LSLTEIKLSWLLKSKPQLRLDWINKKLKTDLEIKTYFILFLKYKTTSFHLNERTCFAFEKERIERRFFDGTAYHLLPLGMRCRQRKKVFDANPCGIEWNSRTQDLSNPSLLKIWWAYHNGRPAPRQEDYKPTQS
jgi:hypothetical protein